MFGVWTFLYGLVLGIRKNAMPNLWLIFFLGSFFGAFIEFLQFILPTKRAAELFDVVADIAGAAGAIPCIYIVLTKYLKDES